MICLSYSSRRGFAFPSKLKYFLVIALLWSYMNPSSASPKKPIASVSNEHNIATMFAYADLEVSQTEISRRLADPDPTSQPSGQPSNQPSNQPSIQPSCQPTCQPTNQPSRQPSGQPSTQPSGQPSNSPTVQPSQQPSVQPSTQPTRQPSQQPSSQPSRSPTGQPSNSPTSQPSGQPTRQPSGQPTCQPSVSPSSQPSRQPSNQPSVQPSRRPTLQPSAQPSRQPSCQPSSQPSNQPSSQPSGSPSAQPSGQPSRQPSNQPSASPSSQPTGQPSRQPSSQPTSQPSNQPTTQPSCSPSTQPSQQPSRQPSAQPSSQPSAQPSKQPSIQPSGQPTHQPSSQPSLQPSRQPSGQPSSKPSGPSSQPTNQPSCQPSSQPSARPSAQPSSQPSGQPSHQPSHQPSAQPSMQPSRSPSGQPTGQPSMQPTMQPSTGPSAQPSSQPSGQPSHQPSHQPSAQPSMQPSRSPTGQPTGQPSMQPSMQPSTQPSAQPSQQPSAQPSAQPSQKPSRQPSTQPTARPTGQPSGMPTMQPSTQPSSRPTSQPSMQPSVQPSCQPSRQPSLQPSNQPTNQPSIQPTCQPSIQPSVQPSTQPSWQPTSQPSQHPSTQPSAQPSMQPSSQPSRQPSLQPTSQPSTQPSSQPTFQPSTQPSNQPSRQPTNQPSTQPSAQPSAQPTSDPTAQPSSIPSMQPSSQPSAMPSMQPSTQPSSLPTMQPSAQPTAVPSTQPSNSPSMQPSMQPTSQPTVQPSMQPSTQPSVQPTSLPTTQPTSVPSSQPSEQPTMVPSGQPSTQPSSLPTSQPSVQPTLQPSVQPSTQPSAQPSIQPSTKPSAQPSVQPSLQPSSQPSMQPTSQPSSQPSMQPSVQPSTQPSAQPSEQPTALPSAQPSSQPSVQPSNQPSMQPSMQPSAQPLSVPTSVPSSQPSCQPSTQPSSVPSALPSVQPTSDPTAQPSSLPSTQPSGQPSVQPSVQPSTQPSSQPTNPTAQPSASPSSQPSTQPTFLMKVLRVQLDVSSVFAEDSALDGLTVSWSELPSHGVQLSIYFDPVNASSVGDFSLPYVYPASFTLTSTSPGVGSQSFAVIGGTHLGLHRLKLALSGSSLREFRASSEGFSSVKVVARGGIVSAPVLLSAVFSFDGTFVSVMFDTPTNRGGYGTVFPCATLLVFPGVSAARCQWTENARITVFPLYTSQSSEVLEVGDTLSVVGNTIRALCDLSVSTETECNSFASVGNATMLHVLAPGTPTKPIVALVVPSAVGACTALSVDISASAGAAGRPWLRGSFEVSASSTPDAAFALQSYLNANYTTNRAILVPSTVLQSGVSYTIQVVLCNFLEACNFAAKTVQVSVSSAILPVVSILGSSPLSVFRTTTLTLASNSYMQSCDGSISRANLRYSWTIRRRTSPIGGFDTVVNAPSVSQDVTVYKLNPFTLASGATYQVTLTATSSVSGTSASDSVVVTVLASKLIARIASGLRQTVAAGTQVALDGSNSNDPDRATNANSNGLLYQWTCSQRLPQFAPNCTIILQNTANAISVVNATLLSINTTSRVTLTIFDSSRSRSASTCSDIVVTGTMSPVLRISPAVSSLASVNTARTLALLGTVQTNVACNAVWSVDDSSLVLSKVTLTAVSTRVPASLVAVPVNLVLSARVLPAGASFVFTLTCGNAATSIEVKTNSAPLPGEFVIAPLSGTELVTVFQFSALLWSDTDLPVTYQFGFNVASSANMLVVSSRSLLSYASTTLPAGGSNSGSSSGVNCTLQVFDSLNAVSTSSKIVSVFSAAVVGNVQLARQQQVLALVTASTTASAAGATTSSSNSISSVSNLISVASAIMNDINCTAAPNCAALFRNPCTRVENTCGACLSGYIGDSGFKNTPCKLISSTVPATNSTIVGECSSDLQCRSYQYCDLTTSTCVSPLKGCNSNCSGHGSCIYLSTITGLSLNTRCAVDNTKCEAVCSCVAGYSGLACEMDVSTLFVRRAVRSQLINSLQNLTREQDINSETLSLWSNSLLSLALNPYELSVGDALIASSIANKTLMYALSQGLDAFDDLVSVLQVTDTLASLQRYNYNPHDYTRLNDTDSTYFGSNSAVNIVQVTSAFGELVVNSMQLGQKRVTYYYENFRLDINKQVLPGVNSAYYVPTAAPTDSPTLLNGGNSSMSNNTQDAIQSASYTPNITIASPRTDFEVLLAEPPITATIFPTMRTSTTVGVKMLSVYPRAYTANTSSFLSTPLFVQLSTVDSTGATTGVSGNYISTIDFTFPFNAEVPVFAVPPTVLNVTSNCSAERGPGRPGGYKIVEYYRTCPGSNTVILHNCTGILGTLVSYCPVLAPTCAHLSVSNAFITPLSSCSVLDYNSTYTTCRCDVNMSDTSSTRRSSSVSYSDTQAMIRRRLQDTDQAVVSSDGTSNMVATASYISADRNDEFSPSFLTIVPETNPKAYIVVYTLASLWGAAVLVFFVFFYQYKKESNKVKSESALKADDACIESGSRMENANSLITAYVLGIIPVSLQQNVSTWKVVWTELTKHHRYFVLFTSRYQSADVYVRSAVLTKILTYITLMMFLLAILYHYQSPQDDNTCDTHTAQASCVREKRMFDPTQSVCSWNYHAHLFMHTCDYKEKYTLPTGFIYMLTLTALGVALLSGVIDVVFRVLTAPLVSGPQAHPVHTIQDSELITNNAEQGSQVLPLTPRHSTQYVRKTSEGRSSWTRSVSPAPLTPTQTIKYASGCELDISDELRELHERTVPLLTGVLHNGDVLCTYRDQMYAAQWNVQLTGGATNKSDTNAMLSLSIPQPNDFYIDISTASPVQSPSHLEVRVPQSPHSPRSPSRSRSAASSPAGSTKRSQVAPAALSHDAALQELTDAVLAHRRLLPEDSEESRQFDAQWGTSVVPVTANLTESTQPVYVLSESAKSNVLNEIQSSERQANLMRTDFVNASPLYAGVLLLHAFILDLLGRHTSAGKIVRNKLRMDFGPHCAVSAEFKLSCALLVLLVNAAMVYYIFYISYKNIICLVVVIVFCNARCSYQRQQMWQWYYLVAVGIQVLFDVCISETFQCVLLHCNITSLARNKVLRVVDILRQLIDLITSECLPHDPRGALESTGNVNYLFDATPFLFASTKLARTRPLLLESALILCYSTGLPGRCSSTWLHNRAEDEFSSEVKLLGDFIAGWTTDWYSQPHQYVGYGILWSGVQSVRFLRWIGTLTVPLQESTVRFLQVVLVCGVILFALAASTSLVALIILVLLVALLVCAVMWRHYYLRTYDPAQDSIKVVPTMMQRTSAAHDNNLHNQMLESYDRFAVDCRGEQEVAALSDQECELEKILPEEMETNEIALTPHDFVAENEEGKFNEDEAGQENGDDSQVTIWNFRSFWEGVEETNNYEYNADDEVEVFEPMEDETDFIQVGIEPETQGAIGELVDEAVLEAAQRIQSLVPMITMQPVFDADLQEAIAELVSDAVHHAAMHVEGIVPAAKEKTSLELNHDLELTASELADEAVFVAAARVEQITPIAPVNNTPVSDTTQSSSIIDPVFNASKVKTSETTLKLATKPARRATTSDISQKPPPTAYVHQTKPKVLPQFAPQPVEASAEATSNHIPVSASHSVPSALKEYLNSPKVTPVERDTKLALAEYFGMMWDAPISTEAGLFGIEEIHDAETLTEKEQAETQEATEERGRTDVSKTSGAVVPCEDIAGDASGSAATPAADIVPPSTAILSPEKAKELQATVQRQAEELAEANRVKAALEARLDETRQLLQMFVAGRDLSQNTATGAGTTKPAETIQQDAKKELQSSHDVEPREESQLETPSKEPQSEPTSPERADTPTKSIKPVKSSYAVTEVPLEADLALQLPIFSRNFLAKAKTPSRAEEVGKETAVELTDNPSNASTVHSESERPQRVKETTVDDGAVGVAPNLPSEEALTVEEASRVESHPLAASLVQESIQGASEKVVKKAVDKEKRRKSGAVRVAKAAVGDIVQQGSSKVATSLLDEPKVRSDNASRKSSVREGASTSAPRVRKSQVAHAASSAVDDILTQGSSKAMVTSLAEESKPAHRARSSTVRKRDKEKERAERAAAQAALIDSYEVTSSIFSSDDEDSAGSHSGSGSFSRSRSGSGSSSGSSRGSSYSGTNSGSYSGSYSSSSVSGDYKSFHDDQNQTSKRFEHFTARNVDTYDPSASIFSSDEDEL